MLTLTATPIPRTLQLALTGVRDLSLIASPPVDRLAVRTFVSPFDPIVVREAILRERYRGGQSFYVCPRIEDLAGAKEFFDKTVPEVKVAVAHGQMPPTALEDIMSAFYDGKYDVLLSTTIIESGLDIPTANTLIVHRADRFGLAQLYQLRGRVGRSKIRAYALFTLPAEKRITAQAERRLKVLQSLDTLGAGFQLASHDLDIRGAGNLLGEEQSGHIKEVGFELYQQMLEEAVTALKAGITEPVADQWSPQITVGTPVLIPEDYVADLSVRLGLYRRIATVENEQEIEGFAAELVDRFGPLPDEVKHLMQIVVIKLSVEARQCRAHRYRPEGRGAAIPRQHLRQSGRPDALHRRPGADRQGAAGHEGGVPGRLAEAGAAAARHHEDFAQAGEDRGRQEAAEIVPDRAPAVLLLSPPRPFGSRWPVAPAACAPDTAIGVVEDEERHALDAGGLWPARRAARRWRDRLRCRVSSRSRGIEPDIGGGLRQHRLVGEVGAFGEIQLHQPLLHLRRLADRSGPMDQAMAVGRVGLPAELVDRIDEPVLRRGGRDPRGDFLVALRRAEFGRQILLARNAFRGNPVIQEIGVVMHLDRNVGVERDRLFEPLLADEAPRANDVGYDIDA